MDAWRNQAKEKLDLFEANMDSPNFINYDMLEMKDDLRPDLILVGESVVNELETHKDVSFTKVAD
jgi:hypothetical protein